MMMNTHVRPASVIKDLKFSHEAGCMFHMVLRINSNYFPKQPHQLIFVTENQFIPCKLETEFLKYYVDELMLQTVERGPSH
jgi:hypothetical protein